MAKFNSPSTIKTVNKEGHAAYSMTPKSRLVTQVLTSFFNEAKFYGDNSEEMATTIQQVIRDNPEFVVKLAVFARREFNMRSVAHVLTAYLAHEEKGKPYVRKTVKGVSLRGDDVTEIMSFYLSTFGKPVPNSLKKGISDVLLGFDEYTLAKYKGTGKSVKMKDLLCICRPRPQTLEQEALFKRCLEDNLKVPETWETQLSANGNNQETWEKLIADGKVGYMALLRNLRNILTAQPRNIRSAMRTLSDPGAVHRSKQLPFRFLSAYKSVSGIGGSQVFDVLEDAVEYSLDNLPKIPGTTVLAVDTSGSMSSPISRNSDIRCCEVGMMLGVMANRLCENAIFYTFDTVLNKKALSTRNGILYTVLHEACAGGGTRMNLPFERMIQDRVKADRIIIISDNQCNGGYWNKPVQALADEYRRQTGNDIWVHAIDLQGYGTQQFHGDKTNIIAGWSEKVLNFILLAEQGEGSLEQTIASYSID